MKISAINSTNNPPKSSCHFSSKILENDFLSDNSSIDTFDKLFIYSPANRPMSVVKNNIVSKRVNLLRPIKTEAEYNRIIKRIFNYELYRTKCAGPSCLIECLTQDGYLDIDKNLKGLVPYCGTSDISNSINCWLTGRHNPDKPLLTDLMMSDIVRAFEFSLDKLDKKYGKYSGTVYRSGYFNPNKDSQYYSTSYFLSCALDHKYRQKPSSKNPYSIIRLKNGHNIYKFQEETKSRESLTFALAEKEVLIDRKSKFRLVPQEEYTPDEESDIMDIIRLTANCDDIYLTEDKVNNMRKYISVWEEV